LANFAGYWRLGDLAVKIQKKGGAMATVAPVRPSPIAGTWYEGDPQALARAVDRYLDQAELPELPGKVVAVIAPHAGHVYSGPVAGYAFAALRGLAPDLVAVVSPVHPPHGRPVPPEYSQPLLTSAHAAYSTPLGEIPIDRPAVEFLDALLRPGLGFGLTPVANDPEHSLEIELPFLQRVLGSFSLLPVMVHTQSRKTVERLGAALAEVLKGRQALLVASTDLSHFYDQRSAERLDAEMLRRFESFEPEAIFEAEETGKGEACGFVAVAAVLWAARALEADTVKVLRHATSGDVTGMYDQVVGYGAAVVLKTTADN
jgi:AmmeMemoRadiSam system protein B